MGILIVSNSKDATVQFVVDHLEEMGAKYFRLNTDLLPCQATLAISLVGKKLKASFSNGPTNSQIISQAKSVWYRRPAIQEVSGLPEEYNAFIKGELETALWSLYTTLDTFWMNPPLISHKLLEHNKLYQMRVAAQIGLKTPDTIVTNNPKLLLRFCKRQGGTIAVKTLKGHFFATIDNEEVSDVYLIYTHKITEQELIRIQKDVRLAPVMAQTYIPKKLELRVTIVGNKVFTCAIHSQASEKTQHDWRRYDFEKVTHESYELPDEIHQKLLSLMKIWGLSFGAIDMILTPANEYVFLEINPNGQWAWIEGITGMPISKAIAELLANPPAK